MQGKIESILSDSIRTKQALIQDKIIIATIQKVVGICTKAFQNDKKIFFCGNGGSAADAQHIAAEFSGRFYKDRKPLFAEALHVNSSYMTAVANDYGYDNVYSRIIQAKGREGDILFGISTSGNSKNILNAFEMATFQNVITIALTGETGGKLKSVSDYLINIPSIDTPRIQEAHILVGHIICQLVEENLFPNS